MWIDSAFALTLSVCCPQKSNPALHCASISLRASKSLPDACILLRVLCVEVVHLYANYDDSLVPLSSGIVDKGTLRELLIGRHEWHFMYIDRYMS